MRPLHVRMQAFGPYAAVQELDFADLREARFFLITGPTGSGKTTLLDAMSLALYGETTSGAERDGGRAGTDMRSQHAAAEVLTEVQFEFALDGQRYRVWRRPEQTRPKKRGGGSTTEPQAAALWRLRDDDGSDGSASGTPDRPLATGWRPVTERVESLLGFRCAQFRQVVMLPQGRFQDLLRADSRQREDILSTLFDTRFYTRIEAALKEEAAAQRRRGEQLRERRLAMLEAAAVADEDELEAEQARQAALLDEAAAVCDACGDEVLAAQRALALGEQQAAALEARAEAAEDLERREAEEEHVTGLRAQHGAALRAAACADVVAECEAREREHAERELHLDRAASAAAAAADRTKDARAALAVEESRAPERDRADEEVRRLRALDGAVAALHALQAAREGAARERDELMAAAAAAGRTAEEAAARAAAAGQREAEARSSSDTAQPLRQVADQALHAADDRRRLAQALSDEAAARQQAEQAARRATAAEASAAAAAAHLAELDVAWRRGQASVLAAGLHRGAPCPVCGSLDHPAPAPSADAPDAEQVEQARSDADRAARDHDDAVRSLTQAQRTHDRAAQHAASLTQSLGDAACRSVEDCEAEAAAAEQIAAQAEAAARELSRLAAEADAARQAALDAAAAQAAAAQAAAEAERAHEAAAARVEERRGDLPPDLEDPAALAAAQAAAAREAAALEAAFGAAREAAHQAALAESTAQAELAAAHETEASARAAAAEASAKRDRRLAEAGFPGPDEWAAACLSASDAAGLEAAVRAHDEALSRARARFQQAQAAAEHITAPDLGALRRGVEDAAGRAETAGDRKAAVTARLDDLARAAAGLQAIGDESRELQRRYEVAGDLAELTSGSNPLRLSFSRFVLGAFLERVLEVASLRLEHMSSGRYELVRSEESRGHGRAAGLELLVADAWTGGLRPVSTLSGGETFMAALSLAVGLAEVVQSYSGGIRLDTIFVDEGFGSLDDEALDLAIDALTGLQEGGRLVGIISHVGELRERIDARLEVSAGTTGSSARFVVP